MSTILIVEDHALSRQALTTLLGYYGHRLLEATNGEEALALLCGEVPDLVITDIVMPAMDGIELVRRLREEPETMETPVIFYTATYRLPEARRLVEGLGKCSVVAKPCEPVELLRLVNDVLEVSAAVPTTGHADAASKWSTELQLAALVDLSFHLVSQRDPEQLLELSCEAFRSILNCRFVRLTLVGEGASRVYGDDLETLPGGAASSPGTREIFAEVVSGRRTLLRGVPESTGEPQLAIPFATPKNVYGWLLFAQKTSGAPFDEKDSEMAATLGAQTALAYENLQLVKDLNAAKEKAESAVKAKRLFLANMSHELRTPMTGMLGMLDLVLEGPLEEQQRDFIQTACTSARSLVRILNDILDLTKIEMGQFCVEAKVLQLRECLEGTLSIMLPVARSKGLDLRLTVAGGLPERVKGDPLRLNQVLTNLAANAVKFTQKGTVEIRVTAGERDGDGRSVVEFAVCDTGIGIGEHQRHLLFQPFSQVDPSHTRNYGGTGLGLVISKEIVERMGGTIGCTSVEGKGSTFSFRIPFREAEAQGSATAEAAPSPPQPEQKCAARILVAEDDQVIREVLRAMLMRKKYVVDLAPDGAQAVELWEHNAYDLILMDVQMPNLDGFGATRAIRQREEGSGRRTPIVALTAHAYEEDEKRCLAAGMDAYLCKPIDFKKAVAVIEALV